MSILEQVDTYLAEAVASWNTYTTLLAVVLALLIAYPVFTSNEPDIHPLLLSRQARPSPIRRKNESATYRGLDVPVGYPLRSGLDIRDPGEPRWKAGRDGDLRDIWRAAMRGGAEGSRGEIMTTCDSRQVFKHDTNQLSRQIAILGHYLEIYNVKRMAICLPNAVELLCALFGGSARDLVNVLMADYDSVHLLQHHSNIGTIRTIRGKDDLDVASSTCGCVDNAGGNFCCRKHERHDTVQADHPGSRRGQQIHELR